MCHVTERPQTLVSKAIIIAFFFFGAKPNTTQDISRIVGRNLETIMTVYGFCVRSATALSYPRSLASTEYRLHCRNQTTGRHCYRNGISLSIVNVGLAVRDYK